MGAKSGGGGGEICTRGKNRRVGPPMLLWFFCPERSVERATREDWREKKDLFPAHEPRECEWLLYGGSVISDHQEEGRGEG